MELLEFSNCICTRTSNAGVNQKNPHEATGKEKYLPTQANYPLNALKYPKDYVVEMKLICQCKHFCSSSTRLVNCTQWQRPVRMRRVVAKAWRCWSTSRTRRMERRDSTPTRCITWRGERHAAATVIYLVFNLLHCIGVTVCRLLCNNVAANYVSSLRSSHISWKNVLQQVRNESRTREVSGHVSDVAHIVDIHI